MIKIFTFSGLTPNAPHTQSFTFLYNLDILSEFCVFDVRCGDTSVQLGVENLALLISFDPLVTQLQIGAQAKIYCGNGSSFDDGGNITPFIAFNCQSNLQWDRSMILPRCICR